jgi:hypothetical protein
VDESQVIANGLKLATPAERAAYLKEESEGVRFLIPGAGRARRA